MRFQWFFSVVGLLSLIFSVIFSVFWHRMISELRMLELKGGQVTLGANWGKWQKHYVLVYFTHMLCLQVSTYFEHMFTIMKLTQIYVYISLMYRIQSRGPNIDLWGTRIHKICSYDLICYCHSSQIWAL